MPHAQPQKPLKAPLICPYQFMVPAASALAMPPWTSLPLQISGWWFALQTSVFRLSSFLLLQGLEWKAPHPLNVNSNFGVSSIRRIAFFSHHRYINEY